jgi:VIT1/CCC1 family predicted Fe2+/Mn2+ transporter
MTSALNLQRQELTEFHIYSRLAALTKDPHNAAILERIANQEKSHYELWKSITKQEVEPNRLNYFLYTALARLTGLNFALKLMEHGEEAAQDIYEKLAVDYPALKQIIAEEQAHEKELLDLINTRALEYAGSVILGLNDALIELSGALIGFTLSLTTSGHVATIGLITGVAASLSMASASYLSAREDGKKNPILAGAVTGTSYIATTLLLLLPYWLFTNPYIALVCTLTIAFGIIAFFNFYTAIIKNISFKKRFAEMAGICLVVGCINFGIGLAISRYLQ